MRTRKGSSIALHFQNLLNIKAQGGHLINVSVGSIYAMGLFRRSRLSVRRAWGSRRHKEKDKILLRYQGSSSFILSSRLHSEIFLNRVSLALRLMFFRSIKLHEIEFLFNTKTIFISLLPREISN